MMVRLRTGMRDIRADLDDETSLNSRVIEPARPEVDSLVTGPASGYAPPDSPFGP